ncbi:MAG: methyltransferase domain-containing protein [Candidatus Omnitrophica bacterium]|nr:methyltransferase domain-containing protein [Candidatus Omnitrophota bacterium]MDD5660339.1 methyltransferase domain-containing protein [Candidatus Omnitrophota bacterium]
MEIKVSFGVIEGEQLNNWVFYRINYPRKGQMKKKINFDRFPCDICGSSDAVEVPFARFYTGNQPIHICKECGFVYVRDRRSSLEIANSWSNEIFGKGYTAHIPAVKARQVYVADFIDKNIGLKNKKVSEIGAGEGQFLDIIRKEYGACVFGIEPSGMNCKILSRLKIPYFQGTIEDYGAAHKKNQSDIVALLWTLENCLSCKDMLFGARKILSPNGYVVIATGSRILVPFKKPLGKYLSKNPSDTHSFRFSAQSLRGLLSATGFKVVFENSYIDSDILCIIARKGKMSKKNIWRKDNYLDVVDFFRRWHKESLFYKNTNN